MTTGQTMGETRGSNPINVALTKLFAGTQKTSIGINKVVPTKTAATDVIKKVRTLVAERNPTRVAKMTPIGAT